MIALPRAAIALAAYYARHPLHRTPSVGWPGSNQRERRPSMQVGIGLPATIPGATADDVLAWARQADAGPFSSLSIIDRLVYGNYEPLITLAVVAGVTTRI